MLVASMGEDLETQVQSLNEDKKHLANALLNSAQHLSTHQVRSGKILYSYHIFTSFSESNNHNHWFQLQNIVNFKIFHKNIVFCSIFKYDQLSSISVSFLCFQEQTEWLAGQCEVWRSKFLASRYA